MPPQPAGYGEPPAPPANMTPEQIAQLPPEYFFQLPQPSQNVVPPVAVLGAGGVAFFGLLAWTAVALVLSCEAAYLAWGIGAAIGWTASYLGGRGARMGVICAVLAAMSLFGGRALTMRVIWEQVAFDDMLSEEVIRPEYDKTMAIAAEYAAVQTDAELRAFLHRHYFGEIFDTPADISDEAIGDFTNGQGPELLTFSSDYPTFEHFMAAEMGEDYDEMMNPGMLTLLAASFGPYDLLFLFLGITTAFFVGGAKDGD